MAAKHNHRGPAPTQMKQQSSHPHGSAEPSSKPCCAWWSHTHPHPMALPPARHSPGTAGCRQEWQGGSQHGLCVIHKERTTLNCTLSPTQAYLSRSPQHRKGKKSQKELNLRSRQSWSSDFRSCASSSFNLRLLEAATRSSAEHHNEMSWHSPLETAWKSN